MSVELVGKRKKVIVVGAGMGGLTAAGGLSRADFEVVGDEQAHMERSPAGMALS